MKIGILSFLIVGIAEFTVLAQTSQNDTLVLLHVLFRHGDRTPDFAKAYPNDPYGDEELYEPYGLGQLTTNGKNREYLIGKFIRSNYGSWIPEQYNSDIVYALSTNFKRTKMSLQLVLASLFPPLDTDVFAEGLNWQPAAYQVEDGPGVMGPASVHCTNFIRGYYRYILSALPSITDSYGDFYKNLSLYTGLDIITPQDAGSIFITLKSQESLGLELPAWTKPIYPELMEEAASLDYECSTATPTLTRLSAGFLLNKIVEDSAAKSIGLLPEERKIFLYSGHEFNVATMLRALGVWEQVGRHVPNFGATILFELHYIGGEYGFQIFYKKSPEGDAIPLIIPGCSEVFCHFDTVYDIIGDNLPGPADLCTYSGELL